LSPSPKRTSGSSTSSSPRGKKRQNASKKTIGSHHSTVLDGYSYNPRSQQPEKKQPSKRTRAAEAQQGDATRRRTGQPANKSRVVASKRTKKVSPGKQSWRADDNQTLPVNRDESRVVLVEHDGGNDFFGFSDLDVPAPPSAVSRDFSGTIVYFNGRPADIQQKDDEW
jgi:hypothetical protein